MKPINKLLHWPYWVESVRMVTFIMVAFIAVFAVSAYKDSQANVGRLLKKIDDNTSTIKSQSNTITSLSKQIKSDTDSIHTQANCIFLFFSQPQAQRNNTTVTYPPACVTSASPGTTPYKVISPTPATTPTQSPSPVTSPTTNPTPPSTPAPKQNILQRIIKAL